jgi:hypothetical protein
MGKEGLEPSRLSAHDPKSCLSANSSTSPRAGIISERGGDVNKRFINIIGRIVYTAFYSPRVVNIWLIGSYHGIVRILGCVRAYAHTPKYGGPPRQFLKTQYLSEKWITPVIGDLQWPMSTMKLPPILIPIRRSTFRWLWVGMGLSYAGDRLQEMAQAWLVAGLSQSSALAVGGIGFLASLPQLLMPLGGAVADCLNWYKLMIVYQIIGASAAAGIGILVFNDSMAFTLGGAVGQLCGCVSVDRFGMLAFAGGGVVLLLLSIYL